MARKRVFFPEKRPSFARRFLGGVILLAVLAFAGAAGAILWDGLTDEPGGADLAVVFGAKVHPDGQPSLKLQARLDRAAALYREGRAKLILVSGAVGVEGRDEAAAMADYLQAQGVPAGAIVQDPAGVDTAATAREAARLMGERGLERALVVTDYFHVPRAKLALRRSGAADVGGAHSSYLWWDEPYQIVREIAAYGQYWGLKRWPARPGDER